MTMLCTLASPITLDDGRVIESVNVRIPNFNDDPPAGIPWMTWNIAKSVNLDFADVAKLTGTDVEAIVDTIDRLINVANPETFLNRAERRRIHALRTRRTT